MPFHSLCPFLLLLTIAARRKAPQCTLIIPFSCDPLSSSLVTSFLVTPNALHSAEPPCCWLCCCNLYGMLQPLPVREQQTPPSQFSPVREGSIHGWLRDEDLCIPVGVFLPTCDATQSCKRMNEYQCSPTSRRVGHMQPCSPSKQAFPAWAPNAHSPAWV